MVLAFPLWVFVCFMFSQYFVSGVAWVMLSLGIPLKNLNPAILNTIIAILVYVSTLTLAILLPTAINKNEITTRQELGLSSLPTWKDILMAPAGLVIYFILSSVLIMIASQIIPGFDVNQVQNTGFNNTHQSSELILAFITLVIVAPVAEETLFRGYLYSKLRKYAPVWVAVLVTSLFFGALHGAWNVGVDTFALSIVLCSLREATGSLWASILLHMMKNGIAFYVLFIAPAILK